MSSLVDERSPGREECTLQRLSVGGFSYWHTDPIVKKWQRIRKGQMIGWTCMNGWHVHLSETRKVDGQRRVFNPLRRDGVLPFRDDVDPVVREIRFYTPAFSKQLSGEPDHTASFPDAGERLDPSALKGKVDVRVLMDDGVPEGFLAAVTDGMPWLATRIHPYRARVTMWQVSTGKLIYRREVWRADGLRHGKTDGGVAFNYHYAPGSHRYMPTQTCIKFHAALEDCVPAAYWLRMWATPNGIAWDTRNVANGGYRLTVRAWDIKGNTAARSVYVTVAN